MRAVTAVGVLLLIASGIPGWVAPSIGRGGAAIGLGLGSLALLYLAFIDPALWALIDENAQYAQIMRFSRDYLPANFGVEPTFQGQLAIDTIQDRLATAVYFMGTGWWLCVGSSVFVLVGCFPITGRRLMHWPDFSVS